MVRWLRSTGATIETFRVTHQERLTGASGDYTFDAVVELTLFQGARIVVLVECKRHKNSVKRDLVLVLESKVRDVGAHKAIMFSTAGFQRGALEYASQHGIALVTFIDGKLTYETRNIGAAPEPRPSGNLPKFAGWIMSEHKGRLASSLLADERSEPLAQWLSKT